MRQGGDWVHTEPIPYLTYLHAHPLSGLGIDLIGREEMNVYLFKSEFNSVQKGLFPGRCENGVGEQL